MQAAIDLVIQTYGMITNLTLAEERAAREKVTQLASAETADERKLAIEGLKYLRQPTLTGP
jgi:hypothetical protein